MYLGDRSRKEVLVAYGFRLPSALDNRPLNFEEWEARVGQVVFVSATPGPYELSKVAGRRRRADHPADRADRSADRRPAGARARSTTCCRRSGPARRAGERVLVTTLTKRMAEDLTQYYQELGVRVRYLHSDIETLERVQILRDLRRGEFDVLVGINLLREGLDLPEVSLVAILDADKEGFLRSAGSLIQTSGRAARNVNGRVIMYADKVTDSMRGAIERNRAAPHAAGGLQPRARHHAAVDRQGDRRGDVERLRARLLDAGGDPRWHRTVPQPAAARRAHRHAAGGDARRGRQPRLREGGGAPRRDQTAAEPRARPLARGGPEARARRRTTLKNAALEVQEYVRLTVATFRAMFTPPYLPLRHRRAVRRRSASSRSPSCC